MFVEATYPDAVLRGLILTVVALVWVTALIRVVGLRALSKMTAFDFVATVAMGSLLAGAAQASDWAGYWQAMVAMAALFAGQWAMARLRARTETAEDLLDTTPRLLMRDGEILQNALRDARMTEADLRAKLREANVLDLRAVRAVVLEGTGDVSVLHGERLSDTLLDGVRGSN